MLKNYNSFSLLEEYLSYLTDTEVKELTPAIIHEFIDKIIIHQPDSSRKNRVQKVEIIYNNIVVFDLSALEQGKAI